MRSAAIAVGIGVLLTGAFWVLRPLIPVQRLLSVTPHVWAANGEPLDYTLRFDTPDCPQLIELRQEFGLAEVVADAGSDLKRIEALCHWTHARWRHDGDNHPSKDDALTILREASDGEGFRCVEYATVFAAAARSLGLPARVLGLMREDIATAKSGAGHVVAEVWSDEFEKWIYVDPQEDVMPLLNGTPLNALELQAELKNPKLELRSRSKIWRDGYLFWIRPYLHFFNFQTDQRQFTKDETKGERILLVPAGAAPPASFQGGQSLEDARVTSDPNVFYTPPNDAG